jgi:hypothetical protein
MERDDEMMFVVLLLVMLMRCEATGTGMWLLVLYVLRQNRFYDQRYENRYLAATVDTICQSKSLPLFPPETCFSKTHTICSKTFVIS